MTRTLTLKSETLVELTDDELGALAGGADQLSGPSCPVLICKTISLHPYCQSGTTCPTE